MRAETLVAAFKELLSGEGPLTTTDFVLAETWRLTRDRLGHVAVLR